MNLIGTFFKVFIANTPKKISFSLSENIALSLRG